MKITGTSKMALDNPLDTAARMVPRHAVWSLVLVLLVLAPTCWAEPNLPGPLAIGNSNPEHPKPMRPAPTKPKTHLLTSKHAKQKQLAQKHLTKGRQPNVSTPVNLRQSELIRQCLQTQSQTPFCMSTRDGFSKYEVAMEKAATSANISPALLKALVGIESNYNDQAKSKMGAIGLTQLMLGTAMSLGLTRQSMHDPIENLNASALHLRNLLNQFANLDMAIAAYLLGENAFKNQIPSRALGYVKNILVLYHYFEDPINPVEAYLEQIQQ